MIVYYGSNIEVIEIDLSKSKRGLDFGIGFYVTELHLKPWQDIYEMVKREMGKNRI